MANNELTEKIKVLVLFGGESPEHEVSVVSAQNVVAALDKSKFEITLVFIDTHGNWWQADEVKGLSDGEREEQLLPRLGNESFLLLPSNTELTTDVIFPVLHGSNGEDGTVQGLARLLHLPIVGCGVLGSAVCMDKYAAKRLLNEAGLPVAPYRMHPQDLPLPSFVELAATLGDVLFVKPANAGSSVGVSKVQSEIELQVALEKAHKYDKVALVEKGIDAHEIEVAVLGNAMPKASVPGEIIPDRDFYDYDSKYDAASTSQAVVPAQLEASTLKEIQELAVAAYQTLECSGLARVDFLVDKHSGKIYLNELNTMPGFTNISMYPKLWQADGLSYAALVEHLISLALEK